MLSLAIPSRSSSIPSRSQNRTRLELDLVLDSHKRTFPGETLAAVVRLWGFMRCTRGGRGTPVRTEPLPTVRYRFIRLKQRGLNLG
jgi:hypothetical protein